MYKPIYVTTSLAQADCLSIKKRFIIKFFYTKNHTNNENNQSAPLIHFHASFLSLAYK